MSLLEGYYSPMLHLVRRERESQRARERETDRQTTEKDRKGEINTESARERER